MRWGFGWELGPFEMCDALGVEAAHAPLDRRRPRPASAVRAPARCGRANRSTNTPPANSPPSISRTGAHAKVPEPPGVIILKSLKDRSKEVARNSGASLIDLGDGVLCCEFHSKMNAIGDDITAMIQTGLKRLNTDFDAMVVANQASNFSVGANLMLLLVAAQEQEWDDIHDAVRRFQNANLALKHAAQARGRRAARLGSRRRLRNLPAWRAHSCRGRSLHGPGGNRRRPDPCRRRLQGDDHPRQ